MAFCQSNYPQPYGGGYGYNPFGGYSGYPPQNFGGGYSYSAYNVNQYQQQPPPQQFPPGFMPAPQMNMIRAPPPMGLISQEEMDEEPEDDDEEEDEEDEEEVEESRNTRKTIKKNIKKKVKATEKINEKVQEDPSILEQYRDMYAAELQKRFELYGTLEPTEGTIKPLDTYSNEDPVFLYTLETEEFELEKWDPEYDCIYLKNAMDGAGTNEEAIINVITTRSNDQRQKLKKQYKTSYGLDLIEELESELSGDFKEAVMAMFVKPAEFDAWCIQEAIYGLGTDESVLIEILTSRTNAQIHELREAYPDVVSPNRKTSENQIEQDIEDDTSGCFKQFLISAVQLSQRDILNSIERETSGDFETGLHALVQNIRCRPMYFAQRLKWCMEGLGTEDRDLIRLIVSRSEIDLVQIKSCFLQLTNKTLWQWILEDTSGDYRHLLCAIVGKN
ncbi:hypothetical protein KUTeg_002987 [Tegillarca granosa]|uniref:Annexin n=1 Tax=Tegillarca granosa TaxID=220873 RepID=A0ABQ9FME6_TEGGR|nr:hypothetical protein KUTeg_002987 [Tegillarca granosa]